jgi:hypothetical protein
MSRENGAEASLKGFESNLAQNLQHDFAKLFGLFKMVVLSRSGVLERKDTVDDPLDFFNRHEAQKLSSVQL